MRLKKGFKQNIMTTSSTKFLYLHDPKNPKRVITVARRVNLTTRVIDYALAICAPDRKNSLGGIAQRGDLYRKAIGRTIASGRLDLIHARIATSSMAELSNTVDLKEEEAPIRTVASALLQDPRPCVQRAARAFLLSA